jgi:L-ascorbate metabolism protein UlaG (beta-lactamase superfamily)
MKLTYLYNSGYVIEGKQCTVIIDYFRDSGNEYAQSALTSFPGKIYVLSSHWHPDHFSRHVLKWKNIRQDIVFIFSKDILKRKFVSRESAIFLAKGSVYQDEILIIKAFGSTDVGISFLIETEGKKIFHAGDLNNWHWDEESTPAEIQRAEQKYLKELKALADETNQLDLAMFPVDCRLGKNYMRGAEQFINAIQTTLFAPMHFGENYHEANAFQTYAEKAGSRFAAWTKTGESILF